MQLLELLWLRLWRWQLLRLRLRLRQLLLPILVQLLMPTPVQLLMLMLLPPTECRVPRLYARKSATGSMNPGHLSSPAERPMNTASSVSRS